MSQSSEKKALGAWRLRLHEIIFEADTPAGRAFDLLLILAIGLSVLAVMADTVRDINAVYGVYLYAAEWFFTILFSVEYVLRLISIGRPIRYATSFFGIIDLLAVVPTYLSLFLPGSQYLIVIRILRVLRVFRILKLARYLGEMRMLREAMMGSRRKITVFLFTVFTLVVILGSLMFLIEGEAGGFTSMPRGIYWAIVTLTTVGYGDISPQSPAGQALAAVVMILGYSIIAIPTGIFTVEIAQASRRKVSTQACPQCSADGHDPDAKFCKFCGSRL